ncbi:MULTISPECIES: signal peptidase II [Cohnella]|uniref:signal peptidase II n=1 Tax=Cohnella TaxID=329857 RepID=UPI0003713D17|nr:MULTISPECIES: signal peptidase II [Cohnella]
MRFYLTFVLTVLIDQLSKLWVRRNMQVGETLDVWPGVLRFSHFENTGAMGSTFQGYGRLFVPLAVAIVVLVLYYRRQGRLRGAWMELGTGLFAGGAIGNAIDRAFMNKVTDFIQWGTGRSIMNVADLLLNIGMVVILVCMLLGRKRRAVA